MAVVPVIFDSRCWPEVEIPIQFRRHRDGAERTFARTSRQTDDDVLELADAPIPNQLAGEPKIPIAALLAAHLENGFVLFDGLHQPLAFINRERQRLLAVNI